MFGLDNSDTWEGFSLYLFTILQRVTVPVSVPESGSEIFPVPLSVSGKTVPTVPVSELS